MAIMPEDIFEQLMEICTFPVYLYRKVPLGYTCDKLVLIDPETKEFSRHRYLITSTVQCTCMSFMKVGRCKHLDILKGDFDWLGDGISSELGSGHLKEILNVMHGLYPNAEPITEFPDMPEVVKALTLGVNHKVKDLTHLFFIKHYDGGGQLGTLLTFQK